MKESKNTKQRLLHAIQRLDSASFRNALSKNENLDRKEKYKTALKELEIMIEDIFENDRFRMGLSDGGTCFVAHKYPDLIPIFDRNEIIGFTLSEWHGEEILKMLNR